MAFCAGWNTEHRMAFAEVVALCTLGLTILAAVLAAWSSTVRKLARIEAVLTTVVAASEAREKKIETLEDRIGKLELEFATHTADCVKSPGSPHSSHSQR